jgi:hypothetical protein
MSTKQARPLPVQLAQASWIAPLLVLLVNFLLRNTSGGNDLPRGVIVSILSLTLYSIGLVCGVAALFGIRRHGRKAILLPALIGTLLSGGLLLVVGTSFWSGYSQARNPQNRLESLAASLREGLPLLVDEETSMDDVTVEGGDLVYDFSLVNYTSEQIDAAAFGDAIKPEAASQVCASLRQILEAGARVKARYRGSDGAPVAEAVITEADCSAGG